MKKRRIGALLAGIALVGVSHAALVAEWNFDDQTLINSGSTAGEHDGAVVSGSAAIPVAATAVFSANTPSGSGYALDLSSVTDYMTIANSSTNFDGYVDTFDSTTDFTYSMWVRNPTNTWTGYGSIAAKGFENYKGDAALKVGFELRAQNFTTAAVGVRVECWDSVSVGESAPYTDLTDQNWHLLTYTYDGTSSNLSLYIDGSLRATGTNSVIKTAPEKLLLFGAVEGEEDDKQSDCIYDSIQFYDHILSASEVADLYIPQTWFTVDPDDISLVLTAPATQVTGTVDVAYMAATNVEVNVSFDNETHVGAFSLLEMQPLVLTNASPATAPLNIVFDADLAGGLTNGEIASCTAIIAWNEQGSTEVTEVEVPVSVEYEILPTDLMVSMNVLGANADAVNPINLSSNGPSDWVMIGLAGDTAARNEMAGADYIGDVTVSGTHGAFAGNAFVCTWTNGAVMGVATNAQGSYEGQTSEGSLSFSVTGLNAGEYSMDLYVSKYKANGQLTATLGGGSHSEVFEDGGQNSGSRYGVFTVDFTVALGESLDVVYQTTDLGKSWGNVGLTAMTLEMTSGPVVPVVGDISSAITSDGSGVILSWGTTPGYQYAVEATDDLVYGTWGNIVTDISGADGSAVVTNTISDDDPQLFFRAYLQD